MLRDTIRIPATPSVFPLPAGGGGFLKGRRVGEGEVRLRTVQDISCSHHRPLVLSGCQRARRTEREKIEERERKRGTSKKRLFEAFGA